MATRRRSSATKSAKVATKPIVKESIKTVKKSSVTTPKRVNNVTQTEIKKVTETPTPEKVRPAQPNLKWEDYRSDAQVRWEIHQYETKELWSDMVKVYHSVKPIVLKSVDYVKDSYDRAFNQDSK